MRLIVLLIAASVLLPDVFGATRITILNADPANNGFNDPTPVTPVGGNEGTTLGEQRLNAFRHAAQIWEGLIESDVEIIVRASFTPMRSSDPCTAATAVLGAATATVKVADFPNAPKGGVLYPVALANQLAGTDLRPFEPDISAWFNADVDNSTCLGDRDWYYGLDGNSGEDVDLVVVLLHELAHGLGMSGSMDLKTGKFSRDMPNIFETRTLDLTTGLRFDQMTAEQRKAAVVNGNQTVWDGPATREAADGLLEPAAVLSMTAPGGVAASYEINPAAFGPRLGAVPVAGAVVAAVDEANDAGPTTTDGCSAYTNASDVAGRVALVDRGTCTFVQKALRAQAARAIGLVVVNNAECGLPPMGGESSAVMIPAVGISKSDGDAIRQNLASGVQGALLLDASSRAGVSANGYVRLYVPCELSQGSSMYHWDITTTPNLLMEPFISNDLAHSVDVTIQQLIDIGWTPAGPSGRRILRRGR